MSDTPIEIPEDLIELIPDYYRRRAEEAIQLTELIKKNDLVTLQRLGHSVKGTAASYGFFRLGQIAKDLDEAAKKQDPAACGRAAEAFIHHVGEIASFLKTKGILS